RRLLFAPPFAGSRSSPRKLHDQGAPLAQLAREADRAAERLHELARDPEAEPEAAGAAARDRALEAAEPAGLVAGVDADAVVADDDRGIGAERAHRDVDRVALPVLDGVAELVGHDLVEAQPVPAPDDGAAGVERELAADAGQLVAEALDDLLDQRDQ